MRTKVFLNRSVFALGEKIGTVKGIEVDSGEWKITHLEIELKKAIAEAVLGVKTMLVKKWTKNIVS